MAAKKSTAPKALWKVLNDPVQIAVGLAKKGKEVLEEAEPGIPLHNRTGFGVSVWVKLANGKSGNGSAGTPQAILTQLQSTVKARTGNSLPDLIEPGHGNLEAYDPSTGRTKFIGYFMVSGATPRIPPGSPTHPQLDSGLAKHLASWFASGARMAEVYQACLPKAVAKAKPGRKAKAKSKPKK